jgi:hypothetical protein
MKVRNIKWIIRWTAVILLFLWVFVGHYFTRTCKPVKVEMSVVSAVCFTVAYAMLVFYLFWALFFGATVTLKWPFGKNWRWDLSVIEPAVKYFVIVDGVQLNEGRSFNEAEAFAEARKYKRAVLIRVNTTTDMLLTKNKKGIDYVQVSAADEPDILLCNEIPAEEERELALKVIVDGGVKLQSTLGNKMLFLSHDGHTYIVHFKDADQLMTQIDNERSWSLAVKNYNNLKA